MEVWLNSQWSLYFKFNVSLISFLSLANHRCSVSTESVKNSKLFLLSVKIATLTCLLFLLMSGWGRRTGVRCVNLGAFADLQVLDELGQSVYLAEWGGHNLGDIASKAVYENTRYVADLLVFCQEKLRREDIFI